MTWGDLGAPSLCGYLRVWTRRVGEAELQHLSGTHALLPAERALQELDAVLGTSRAIR